MIKSMTGFGQASMASKNIRVEVEIKSINSRFSDIILRIPELLSDKEQEIRNQITNVLERGKITMFIECHFAHDVSPRYDETLIAKHYTKLKELANRVGARHDNIFELTLNSLKTLEKKKKYPLEVAIWTKIKKLILVAITQCDQFREKEGKALKKKMHSYGKKIISELKKVQKHDPQRLQKIQKRIKEKMDMHLTKDRYDQNRFEQEMIFYFEKIDITEEQVRLTSHLTFFMETLEMPSSSGKKLGFIAQEINREINTIGSKANDVSIQKSVVLMKEELEKIKEQLTNIV